MVSNFKEKPLKRALRNALLTTGIVAISGTALAEGFVPANCTLYGINDKGLDDSQFVVIHDSNTLTQLGPTYAGADIEAIDINGSDFYATSGDNQKPPYAGTAGHLYKVNKDTGAITSIGNIHFKVGNQEVSGKEVSAISFNHADGTLWGWAEFCGLLKIDTATAAAELKLVYPNEQTCLAATPDHVNGIYTNGVEDMTWNLAGDKIYFTFGDKNNAKDVFVYVPAIPEVKLIHGPASSAFEAIRILPDGNHLLLNTSGSKQFIELDLTTDPVSEAVKPVNAGLFGDIEGFTWFCPPDGGNVCTSPMAQPGRTSVTVPLNDSKGSAYKIELVSHEGNQWVYKVSNAAADGRELSHWSLGLGECAVNMTDAGGGTVGKDPSTPLNFEGVKWDTKGGTFTITMDKEYPVGTVDVLVKAGGKGSSGDNYYATGKVAGPVCGCPETSTPPSGGDTTPPPSGGDTTPPPSGGDTTPPPSGGDTTPPPSGGDTTPPPSGGDTTPPPSGGDTTPPPSGGDTTPPPSGGDTTPPPSGGDTTACPTDTGTSSVTVSMPTNSPPESAYSIALTNRSGNSWTYKVEWVKGKDLSHWDLALGNCINHVTNTGGGSKQFAPAGDPSNADPAPGADLTVKGSSLIKWDTKGGTFTITLDGNYAMKDIPVLAKTATVYNTGMVAGPDCATPVPATCPTSGSGTTTPTSGSGTTTTPTSGSGTTTTPTSGSGTTTTPTSGSGTTTTPTSGSGTTTTPTSGSGTTTTPTSGSGTTTTPTSGSGTTTTPTSGSGTTTTPTSGSGTTTTPTSGSGTTTTPTSGSGTTTTPTSTCPTTTDKPSVNVSMPTDNPPVSEYSIALTNRAGNSWTYTVNWVRGKDLSHWDLALGNCLSHVTNITGGGTKETSGDPSNASPATGADLTVKGSQLIKWNTTGGTFTVTLDGNYPAANIPVLAKTATVYNTGTVAGPDCTNVCGATGSSTSTSGTTSSGSTSTSGTTSSGSSSSGKGGGKK